MTPINIENAHDVLGRYGIPSEVIGAVVQALTWAGERTGNTYAAAYLKELDRAGLYSKQLGREYEEGVKVNILYALGNLTAWRGDHARATKAILRRYTNGV